MIFRESDFFFLAISIAFRGAVATDREIAFQKKSDSPHAERNFGFNFV
jgi:hypothetical protein